MFLPAILEPDRIATCPVDSDVEYIEAVVPRNDVMKSFRFNTLVEIDKGIADTFIDHFISDLRTSWSKEKAARPRAGIYDRCDCGVIQGNGLACFLIEPTCDHDAEALGLKTMGCGPDAVCRPVVVVVALRGNASGPDGRITA